MTNTIQYFSAGRDNNLNLIRFLAATLVIFTHSYGITASGEDPFKPILGLSLGSIAVDIFFVVSGFLIAKSWASKRSLTQYYFARFKRIYPALWAATLLSVLVVGPFFSSLAWRDFIQHKETLSFVAHNATLLPFGAATHLPGVFDNAAIPRFNVSLWTLPHEMRMYILLSLFAIAGVLLRAAFLLPLVGGGFIVFALMHLNIIDARDASGEPSALQESVRFVFLYFSGTLLYALRERIVLRGWIAAALAMATAALMAIFGDPALHRLAVAAALPYLVAYIAFVPRGGIRAFNRLGDYSYGLYIYAFPVQQSLQYAIGGNSLINFLLSFGVTLLLAVASWHYLEEKSLALQPPKWLMRLDAWEGRWIARPLKYRATG